MAANP
jgi:DNA-directed RNA polymerase II subunit RPB3